MSDREERTLQVKQGQMQPEPLTLREHIWSLPTELVDMIHEYIYEGPLVPFNTNITIQQASYRVPAMLQLTSALRRQHRETYYTKNFFTLPDFATYQKWIASISEHAEVFAAGTNKWECSKCKILCRFEDMFIQGGNKWSRHIMRRNNDVKVRWHRWRYSPIDQHVCRSLRFGH